jgi:hypothetical protein
MNDKIIQAHNKWKLAEDKAGELKEYEKGYKSRQAKARKLWKDFSILCTNDNLKPVEVAVSLTRKTLTIKH